jgi:hypothetical protein
VRNNVNIAKILVLQVGQGSKFLPGRGVFAPARLGEFGHGRPTDANKLEKSYEAVSAAQIEQPFLTFWPTYEYVKFNYSKYITPWYIVSKNKAREGRR